MQLTIQISVTDELGNTHCEKILTIEKSQDARDDIGLSIRESKQLLKCVQQSVIQKQAWQHVHNCIACPHCQKPRRIKGCQTIQYRTLFGVIPVLGHRVYRCNCEQDKTKTVSLLNDWVSEHTHPELKYIETKWASLMSYGLTSDLLKDILPVGERHNASTVRNHLCHVAKRQEAELAEKPDYLSGCPRDWGMLPKPGKPMVVGIDGGYVRNRNDKKNYFEVIVGKSYSDEVPAKRFGFVQKIDDNPRKKLMAQLTSQGMQANQQITFLSDGADNLRELQFNFYPESRHVLDWFHITMRLTVLNQYTKGVEKSDPAIGTVLSDTLESTKWYLWNGNVEKSLEHLEECTLLCDDNELKYFNSKKLLKHLDEMYTYIKNNRMIIPNYGEMYRYGETISTAFVESTINEVVAKRMVKKQQMQWSQKGAHYLLQTRTTVLNGQLREQFRRWYPDLKIDEPIEEGINESTVLAA